LQRSHRQNPIAGLLDLGEGAGEPFRLGRSDLGIPSGAFNPSFALTANQKTCASISPSSQAQSSLLVENESRRKTLGAGAGKVAIASDASSIVDKAHDCT
jgi:hypothetical protein